MPREKIPESLTLRPVTRRGKNATRIRQFDPPRSALVPIPEPGFFSIVRMALRTIWGQFHIIVALSVFLVIFAFSAAGLYTWISRKPTWNTLQLLDSLFFTFLQVCVGLFVIIIVVFIILFFIIPRLIPARKPNPRYYDSIHQNTNTNTNSAANPSYVTQ